MLLGHKGKKKITAPVKHDPGKGYDTEHLAYLSPTEMEILRHMTDGTVSRGPRGIPSFVAPPSTAQKAANAAAMAAATQRAGPATIGGTPNTPGALGGNQGSQRPGGSNAGSQKPGGTNNGAMGGTGLRGPTGPQGQAKSQAQMQGVNQTAAAMANAAAKGQLGQPQGAFQGGGQGAFGEIAGGPMAVSRPGSYAGPKGTTSLNEAARYASVGGVGMMPRVAASPTDMDTMARLMLAESSAIKNKYGAVSTPGLQGVAEVLRNRVVSEKFPDTLGGVMYQGYQTKSPQFTPMGTQYGQPVNSYSKSSPGYQSAYDVAKAVLAGEAATMFDPTQPAPLNYANISHINKPGSGASARTRSAFNAMAANPASMTLASATNPSNQHTFGTIGQSDVQLASLSPVAPSAPRQSLSQISRASVTPTSLATKSQGVNPPVDDPGYIGMMPTPRGMPIALPGAGAVPGPISRPGSGFPTQLATRSQGVSPPLDDPGFNTMMGAPRGMPTALPGAGAVPGMIQRQTAPQWNDTGRVNFNDMLSDKVTAVEPARQPPSTFAGPGSPTYASPVPSRSPLDMAPTPQPGINPVNLVEGGVPAPLQSVTTMGIDDKASYWGVNLEAQIAGAFINPDKYPEVKAQIEKAKAAGVSVNPVTGQVTAPKSAMAELGKLWDAMARSKYAGLPALEDMTQVASTGMVPTPRQKPQTLSQVAAQTPARNPSYFGDIPSYYAAAPKREPSVWDKDPMPYGMPANIGKWLEQGKPTPPAKPHLGTPASQTADSGGFIGMLERRMGAPGRAANFIADKLGLPSQSRNQLPSLLGGNMQVDPGDRGSKRKKRRRRGAFQQVTA